MKYLLILLSCLSCFSLQAKTNYSYLAKDIINEGKRLYRTEMASRTGSEIILKKYNNKDNIGGNFSYVEKNKAICIYYSKGDSSKVIASIAFDSTFDINKAEANYNEREFTLYEKQLFLMKTQTLFEINSDPLFKQNKEANFSIIPIISSGKRKVYVISSPKNPGFVIFGNDYLLTYDKDIKLDEKKQLHKGVFILEYNKDEKNTQQMIGGVHTHTASSGEFMSATDICTLMLYGKLAKWKFYTVVSSKFTNIWDCTTDELSVYDPNE